VQTLKNIKVTEVTTHSMEREVETEGLSGGLEHESIEIHKSKQEFQLEEKPRITHTLIEPRVMEHRKRHEIEEERGEGSLERRHENVIEEEKEFHKGRGKHSKPVKHTYREVKEDINYDDRPVLESANERLAHTSTPTSIVKEAPSTRVIYSDSTSKRQPTDTLGGRDYTVEEPQEFFERPINTEEQPPVVRTKQETPVISTSKQYGFETSLPTVISTAVSPRPSIRYYRDVTSNSAKESEQSEQEQREEDEEQEERLRARKKDTERKIKEQQRAAERTQDLERHLEDQDQEEPSKTARAHPKAKLDAHRRKHESVEPRTMEEFRPVALDTGTATESPTNREVEPEKIPETGDSAIRKSGSTGRSSDL
jgi:hypothetical protein